MTARYAIYFAPPHGSPWWKFGAHWLGRDECSHAPLSPCASTQLEATELFSITAEPRRYGFHATLKAPFRLSREHTVNDLTARMQALAAALKPVALGPLNVAMLGDFVALAPTNPPPELPEFAATCVTELDDLRAPLMDADLQRRNVAQLDARETDLLRQYGYPYVMERFRFHFTLTGRIAHATRQRVSHAVATEITRLNREAPLCLDRLCLFVEPAPGAPFKRMGDMQVGP